MAKAYIDRMGYDRITPELADKAASRLEEGRAKIKDDDAFVRFVGSGAWAMPDKQLKRYARREPIAAKDAWRIFGATDAIEREHPGNAAAFKRMDARTAKIERDMAGRLTRKQRSDAMDMKGREQFIRPNVSLLSGYGLEALLKHGQEGKRAAEKPPRKRKRAREKAMGKSRVRAGAF